MRKNFTLAIAAIMVLGLAVAAFAYTRSSGTFATAMSCCDGDKCPLKNKNAATGETASCCDNCECCGDSCPLKNKADASATAVNMEAGKMEAGKSCPMMGKAESTTAVRTEAKPEVKADGKSCSCSCCSGKKENKDAPTV